MDWYLFGLWIRDYIGVVCVVWCCWQIGDFFEYQGMYYYLDLMVLLFDFGFIDYFEIFIYLVVVKFILLCVVGEVVDGIRFYFVCMFFYIWEVMFLVVCEGVVRVS